MLLKVHHQHKGIFLVLLKKVESCLKDIPKPVVYNPVSQPPEGVPTESGNIVLCNYLNENINEEKRLFIIKCY